jgi:hypothetical protein
MFFAGRVSFLQQLGMPVLCRYSIYYCKLSGGLGADASGKPCVDAFRMMKTVSWLDGWRVLTICRFERRIVNIIGRLAVAVH